MNNFSHWEKICDTALLIATLRRDYVTRANELKTAAVYWTMLPRVVAGLEVGARGPVRMLLLEFLLPKDHVELLMACQSKFTYYVASAAKLSGCVVLTPSTAYPREDKRKPRWYMELVKRRRAL